MSDQPYVDPNSGAAPQPGGFSTARSFNASASNVEFSDGPQDEATSISDEQADQALAGDDLESKTKAELAEMAESRDIDVRPSMTKADLIEALRAS